MEDDRTVLTPEEEEELQKAEDEANGEEESSDASDLVTDDEEFSGASSVTSTDYDGDPESNPDEEEIGDYRIHNSGYKKSITSSEANELKRKISELTAELNELMPRYNAAVEMGDLRENSAYEILSEKKKVLEQSIAEMDRELKTSQVVDNQDSLVAIGKGSKVHLTITDPKGIMKPEIVYVEIVSEGHGGIPEDGSTYVRVPVNSEVYRNMADKQSGSFVLTGTDGNNYNYQFEIVR